MSNPEIDLKVSRLPLYDAATAAQMAELPTYPPVAHAQQLCGVAISMHRNRGQFSLGLGIGFLLQGQAGEDTDVTDLSTEERDRAALCLSHLIAFAPITPQISDVICETRAHQDEDGQWSLICLRRSIILIDQNGDFPTEAQASGIERSAAYGMHFSMYLHDDGSSRHDDLKELQSGATWVQDYLSNSWGFLGEVRPINASR